MPTPNKRVQVLLKPRALEIIEKISEDENLSLSKICSLLIEEALVTRGAYSKTSHMVEVLPPTPERDSLMRRDSVVKAGEQAEQKQQVTDEDLRLLAKIKGLRELGLL